jgi:thymidylate synthase
MQTFLNFTEAYYALVDTVYNDYHFECAPRGQKIRECLGMTFAITDPRNRLLHIPERKFSLQYVMAEVLWYMMGEDKTEWIGNYSAMWKNISDDGVTANSAYGSRIFRPHARVGNGKFVQWEYVKEELRRDPDSRRAVIHIRTPDDSVMATKDVPCTLALQFFIRDGRLCMIANMRSTDLIFGLANDVPAFTFMQEMMAFELGLELGAYIHVSNSLHIYERHFEMCEKILAGLTNYTEPPTAMPSITLPMPTDSLDKLQWAARATEDPLLLRRLANAVAEPDAQYDVLWRDWARILVLHRADKLKLNEVREEIVASLESPQFKQIA